MKQSDGLFLNLLSMVSYGNKTVDKPKLIQRIHKIYVELT